MLARDTVNKKEDDLRNVFEVSIARLEGLLEVTKAEFI